MAKKRPQYTFIVKIGRGRDGDLLFPAFRKGGAIVVDVRCLDEDDCPVFDPTHLTQVGVPPWAIRSAHHSTPQGLVVIL